MKKKVKTVAADYKDVEDLLDQIFKSIKSFGLHVYQHPDFQESDMYGFIISDKPLTRQEIKELCIDEDEG